MNDETSSPSAPGDWSMLMAQAQQGDQQRFVTLLTEVSKYLRPYLKKKMGNRDEVEDVLQEILLTLHKARHTYDAQRPFKPWLMAVANSRIAEFWKKTLKVKNMESQWEETYLDLQQAEEEVSRITIESFQGAMNSLPDKQQEIVTKLKFEGKSIKAVAEELRMSESAVKVAAHRGYKKIYEVVFGKPD